MHYYLFNLVSLFQILLNSPGSEDDTDNSVEYDSDSGVDYDTAIDKAGYGKFHYWQELPRGMKGNQNSLNLDLCLNKAVNFVH